MRCRLQCSWKVVSDVSWLTLTKLTAAAHNVSLANCLLPLPSAVFIGSRCYSVWDWKGRAVLLDLEMNKIIKLCVALQWLLALLGFIWRGLDSIRTYTFSSCACVLWLSLWLIVLLHEPLLCLCCVVAFRGLHSHYVTLPSIERSSYLHFSRSAESNITHAAIVLKVTQM